MYLSPDATVKDVKEFLSSRLELASHVELRLTDENVIPVFGAFQKNRTPMTTRLNLRVVHLDPRLEALFQNVGMEEETERDRMMEHMLVPRGANDCPGNHSLPIEQAQHGPTVMMCSKCRWYAFRGSGCEICGFALCRNCLQNDNGLTVVDPYEELVRIATSIGKEMADLHCRCRGLIGTSLRWEPAWGEICPSLFIKDPKRIGVSIENSTRVLHCGVRLNVRLSERLRHILAADNGQAGAYTSIRHSEVLYPGEVDKVLPNGATLQEMNQLKAALTQSDSWSKVTCVLKQRIPESFAASGDDPKAYETTMKLVSFEAEQVIYEVGARIDGSYLASLRSFPGECGFSFGNRARHIQHRLRSAGAEL